MITEVQVFIQFPPDDERRIWCDWLRFHGIDPHDVSIPGSISVDYDRYRIHYEKREFLDRWEPDGQGGMQRVLRTLKMIHQLEGRPRPMPRPRGNDAPEVPKNTPRRMA